MARPLLNKRLPSISVTLDKEHIDIFWKIGKGNVSKGIRKTAELFMKELIFIAEREEIKARANGDK